MDSVILNNGISMPVLGFGVFQITDPELCEESVCDALKAGYRLIDTAAAYGNEEAVGRGIKRSGVPREELFITTKLWVQDYGDGKSEAAFERSLKRLGLDYLDLYLMHQPFGDVYGAWRSMERIYEQGLVRAIGVSNFQPDRLIDLILHNNIKPAINQVECNPYCQQIENHKYMKEFNVQMQAWSPLATGRNNIFENELLLSISHKYKRSLAQIVLRWIVQRGIVVIPKAVSKEHILQNINIFDFQLSQEDMEAISSMNMETSVYFGTLSHRDPETVKSLGMMKFNT